MSDRTRPKGLVIKLGQAGDPWWWKHIDRERLPCELDYHVISLDGGRPTSPFTLKFLQLAARAVATLFRARRDGYRYVFTLENDWLTFIVGGLQTLLALHLPRHVILLFVMRERAPGLKSTLKYAFMRWCFSSVHLCVCPSSFEVEHYASVFGWPRSKVVFVPSPTNPELTALRPVPEEPVVLSAGRTFRDYPTLLEAVSGTDLDVTIVAGRDNFRAGALPPNVTVHYDLPNAELTAMIARCMIVVVPLEARDISAGQSVVLEALALGKAVVATRVVGTVDYLENMKTGILVPPNDASALREALSLLAGNEALRRRLGETGREQVLSRFLPRQFARSLSRALNQPNEN